MSRYCVFCAIAIVGVASDLVSKHLAFAWLGLPGKNSDNTYWLWEGYVGIQTAVNQGALFGLGRGYGWLFIALSMIAAIGIPIWLFYARAAHDWLLTIALAGVMGGIFGNLYDRLGLWHGADIYQGFRNGVRDWILLQYGKFTWPNFNIADCLLVCGAILLAWHAFRYRDVGPSKSAKNGTPTSS